MPVSGQTPTRVHLNGTTPAANTGYRNATFQAGSPYPDPNDPTYEVRDVTAELPSVGGVDARSTTSETIGIASMGMAVTFADGSPVAAIAVSLDSTAPNFFWCVADNKSTQTITFTPTSGAIDTATLAAGSACLLFFDGTNWKQIAFGGSGGGSGTVTDTGGLINHGVVVGDSTAHDIKSIATGTSGQFLKSAGSSADPAWASIAESDVTNLTTDLAAKAPLASPTFTGTPAAPTPSAGDNSTKIATTAFVDTAIGTTSNLPSSIQAGAFGIVIDGGSSSPATGSKGFLQVPYACTITGWTMLADQSGSAQITVKKSTYSGFPTTSSIVASAPPNLSTAQKNTSTTLTGWTTSLSAGDILEFNLDSVTTCQRILLKLAVTRA